jgi:hypothetical protein
MLFYKGRPKRRLLHHVDQVTLSRFFLGLCSQMPGNLLPSSPPTTFAGPKYRKPKMGPHGLRARSFEDGCLCSILHGPLQLQIWTAFLLPARLFPTAASQSATVFSQSYTLLFLFPARFSVLHCSPQLHKRGCRRSNPSNAALPSTVRLLPTCSVGTSICLSRTTNLPLSGRGMSRGGAQFGLTRL